MQLQCNLVTKMHVERWNNRWMRHPFLKLKVGLDGIHTHKWVVFPPLFAFFGKTRSADSGHAQYKLWGRERRCGRESSLSNNSGKLWSDFELKDNLYLGSIAAWFGFVITLWKKHGSQNPHSLIYWLCDTRSARVSLKVLERMLICDSGTSVLHCHRQKKCS